MVRLNEIVLYSLFIYLFIIEFINQSIRQRSNALV